jgi:hypothetical protein
VSEEVTQHPDHKSRGHHPQGPSQLKALQKCPGFENRPGTSAAAEMGTRIHEALEVRDPSNLESELEVELFEKCVVSEDKLIAEYFGDETFTRYNELPLTMELNGGLELWGTGDVLCISESGLKGLAIDYKSGRMQVDDAVDNLQARAYKNGSYEKFPTLEELRFIFLAPQIDWINWHDFLPESVDVDRQIITMIVSKAQDYRSRWASGEINKDYSELSPNDNCTYCRHAQYCPANNEVLLDFAEASGVEVPDHVDITNLDDPDQVALLYGIAKMIEPLLARIKSKAVDLAHEGEVLPGWELRSMGAKRIPSDNKLFWDYCATQGITLDELLENINIPVAKLRDLLKDKAPQGAKGQAAQDFIDEGVDTGVILLGKERFTLKAQSSDD